MNATVIHVVTLSCSQLAAVCVILIHCHVLRFFERDNTKHMDAILMQQLLLTSLLMLCLA